MKETLYVDFKVSFVCSPDKAVESKSEFGKSNFIIPPPHSGGSKGEKEQKNIKKRKNLDCHVI